jgi:SIR2-like domain
VLLGAGASVDAGIPAAVGMTDALIERLSQQPTRPDEHVRLLEYIRKTLEADAAVRGSAGIDVERLFAAVDLLIHRHDEPWSPFVSSWSRALETFSPLPSIRRSDLNLELRRVDDALRAALLDSQGRRPDFRSPHQSVLSEPLGQLIDKMAHKLRASDVSEVLSVVRDDMLYSLLALLRIEAPSQVEYLKPLVELATAQGSLTVATLNYDRSVEEVAKAHDAPYTTGIATWLRRGELKWQEHGLRLLKLHGSIDWIIEKTIQAGQLPVHTVEEAALDERRGFQLPGVVFGEAGKLRAEGPFLELLLAWATQMTEATSLLIVGYSFRDPHVNEIIARWFNANTTRRIILLDPNMPSSSNFLPYYFSFVEHLMRVDQPLPNKPEPEFPRVQFVQATAAQGLRAAIEAATELST